MLKEYLNLGYFHNIHLHQKTLHAVIYLLFQSLLFSVLILWILFAVFWLQIGFYTIPYTVTWYFKCTVGFSHCLLHLDIFSVVHVKVRWDQEHERRCHWKSKNRLQTWCQNWLFFAPEQIDWVLHTAYFLLPFSLLNWSHGPFQNQQTPFFMFSLSVSHSVSIFWPVDNNYYND